MNKHILIINTGGTLSSVKTKQGYEPLEGYLEGALKELPSLQHSEMPSYEMVEFKPLLDSSNMNHTHWNQIGEIIAKNYDRFDGFVVFHGTDTMAFTASALSFMLENLKKPVILTGSQIPLSEIRNDAESNIITSMWLAAHTPLSEVSIYFNRRLLRGNRSRKMSSEHFSAFDSPNYPQLADIGIHIELHEKLLLQASQEPFHFTPIRQHAVATFRLFPGFDVAILEYLLKQPLHGLILETYGAGNAPNNNSAFLKVLEEGVRRGIVIVNCTQCPEGHVEMNQYATGHTLKEAGLISGHDMTPETLHAKLLYLFSKENDISMIKRKMEENLAGELSLRNGVSFNF